jgi:hypothetical protein
VEGWLVVWLVIGLVTTGALLVMLGFLVRHVILLGRTASRMQAELQPIAEEIAAASSRAADTAAWSFASGTGSLAPTMPA